MRAAVGQEVQAQYEVGLRVNQDLVEAQRMRRQGSAQDGQGGKGEGVGGEPGAI